MLKLLIGHEVIGTKEVLGLAIVELMVTRDNGDNRRTVFGNESKRLARAILGEPKELGNGLNGAKTRRVHLLKRAVARALSNGNSGGCRLFVGRKTTVIAIHKCSLAGIGKRHELNGGVAADLARVSHNRQRLEPAALTDIAYACFIASYVSCKLSCVALKE